MNKHTISERCLGDFLRSFNILQECLAKCDEVIVKARFHVGCYTYSAKIWSEKKKEGAGQ